MQEAYAFILDYKELLVELKATVCAVEYIETVCKTEGLNLVTCRKCKNISHRTSSVMQTTVELCLESRFRVPQGARSEVEWFL